MAPARARHQEEMRVMALISWGAVEGNAKQEAAGGARGLGKARKALGWQTQLPGQGLGGSKEELMRL